MELFHEYKNKYFHLVLRILNLSKYGLYREEIIKLIEEEEYDEKIIGKDFRTFEGMLLNEYGESENFNLLRKEDDKYYSVINKGEGMPLKVRFSKLEKNWLNGMIKEPIVQALLGEEIIKKLESALKNVTEGSNDTIEFTNKVRSDSDYDLKKLVEYFYIILEGIIEEKPIKYTNVDKDGDEYKDQLALPIRIEFSLKDNKFRASFFSLSEERAILVNLHTLKSVKITENIKLEVTREDVLKILKQKKYCNVPITIELTDIRGAMERCFMSFSSYERSSRFVGDNKYEIDIYYYTFEEADVIRKIMSLGPYVKIKSPSRVKHIIIDRITKAFEFQKIDFS